LCDARIVSVDVPDPPELSEILVELKLSRGPLGMEAAERDTVPVNPAMLDRLTVTVPLVPETKLREDGFTATVKSWTLTVIVTEWDDGPLVPVTVTVYVPTVLELRERVEELDPPEVKLTVAGLMEAVSPVGVTDVVRLTMPLKPATLSTVIDEVPELPAWMFTVVGLAEIVKSPTWTVTVAVWDREPLVAVMVTV
jgi:hypothetical protein